MRGFWRGDGEISNISVLAYEKTPHQIQTPNSPRISCGKPDGIKSYGSKHSFRRLKTNEGLDRKLGLLPGIEDGDRDGEEGKWTHASAQTSETKKKGPTGATPFLSSWWGK